MEKLSRLSSKFMLAILPSLIILGFLFYFYFNQIGRWASPFILIFFLNLSQIDLFSKSLEVEEIGPSLITNFTLRATCIHKLCCCHLTRLTYYTLHFIIECSRCVLKSPMLINLIYLLCSCNRRAIFSFFLPSLMFGEVISYSGQ